MSRKRVDYTRYLIVNVTDDPHLWEGKDPVRPWLSTSFRVSSGRNVFGLYDGDSEYAAFVCVALTTDVPRDEAELKSFSASEKGIYIPYTVWSSKKGAGKALINKLLDLVREKDLKQRVVTLSPISLVAKRFHTKNGAKELRVNQASINFEY